MSGTATPVGARERDTFVSMLARLDAQLDRDLGSTEGGRTDFVPTLQLLKPDEIAALAVAPHAASRAVAARPARSLGRLLPWLVGGGLAAGAASLALSFSGPRMPLPRTAEVAAIVPVVVAVPAAPAVPAMPAVPAPAVAATPTPVAASAPVATQLAAAAPTPPDSCSPARRALGLCEVPAP